MTTEESHAAPLILAIDDEVDILEIVKATLEGEGFRVEICSDPEKGVRFYEQNSGAVQLVLLDYLMPGMTGDLVFDYLRGINPDVRVMLLTACDDQVAKAMFAKGLRGYMQKPFYLDDLIARVREELEGD